MIRLLSGSLKIVSIIILTLMLAGGSIWFFNYWVGKEQPRTVGRAIVFQLKQDEETDVVADRLKDAGLITHTWYFETKMRFGSYELRPGTYNLFVGMSTNQIIDTIAIEVANTESIDTADEGPQRPASEVTFIEGQRIEENALRLEAVLPGGGAEYITLAHDIEFWRDSYTFLKDVPADGSLEGFLFPSTYPVPGNASAASVIDYQLTTFEANLSPELQERWQLQGLTVFQAVTLASIVEREAAVALERPMIAEVYLNRVNQGMNLNADPSQQYGIGTGDNWWPALDTTLLERSKETPYDTYINIGLPPGPISNPGAASLQSVAQPTTEGYLYFVTLGNDSGEHRFTFTLAEHEAATCEEHPDWEACQ